MHVISTLAVATLASAGIVSVPLSKGAAHHEKRSLIGAHHARLRRDSANAFDLEALNNITGKGYYADLEIGTPPQKLTFHLDTGSSDTWMNSDESELCSSSYQQTVNGFCTQPFRPGDSSTFKIVERDGFNISYLDQRHAVGDYFNDTITFAGATVKNQQLGLAIDSTIPNGLMGLGLSANVASKKKYPTVLDNMFSQGLINRRAFSMFLNDMSADSGSILFGGVDKKKYIGSLAKLPMQVDGLSSGDGSDSSSGSSGSGGSDSSSGSDDSDPLDGFDGFGDDDDTDSGFGFKESKGQGNSTNEITTYSVNLKGFRVDGVPNVPSVKVPVLLDSGSSISIFPNAQVKPLHDFFDVEVISQIPTTPFVDCGKSKDVKDVSFTFEFEGKDITVPGSEMILDWIPKDAQKQIGRLFDSSWSKVCVFGMVSLDDYLIDPSAQLAILGDTFLRSAYVVYDIDDMAIGLAQANVGSHGSEIVEFTRNGTIPSVQGVDHQEENAASLRSASSAWAAASALAVAAAFMAL